MRILLVEDCQTDAELIQSLYPHAEWVHVTRVHDSHDIGSCDVIVSDLMLPDLSGVETIEHLHSGFPHLPLVAVTNADDSELHARCLIGGADSVFHKSDLSPSVLVRAIEVAIRAHAVRASSSGELAATKDYVIQAAHLIQSISQRIEQLERLI